MTTRPTRHAPQVRIPRDIIDVVRRRAVELTVERGVPVSETDVIRAAVRRGVAHVTVGDLPAADSVRPPNAAA